MRIGASSIRMSPRSAVGYNPGMSGRSSVAEVTRVRPFEAAHRLWRPELNEAANAALFGRESARWGHGHNYTLLATVAGPIDPASGMILNVRELDGLIGLVLAGVDHRYLNEEYPALGDQLPTLEWLSVLLWRDLADRLRERPELRLARLRLVEGERTWADYTG